MSKSHERKVDMNRKKSSKITKRELRLALWIAEQGAVRLSTLAKYLKLEGSNIHPSGVRRLAQKLVENKLANKEQILAGSSILWPTADSLLLAGFPAKRGGSVRKPSLSNLLHSLIVSEIRVIYESNGAEWICERKLIDTFPQHLPDGLAIHSGVRIIIEVDISRKEKNRIISIMKMNASIKNHVVDYWITPELKQVFEEQKNLLPRAQQENVRSFLIPEELL